MKIYLKQIQTLKRIIMQNNLQNQINLFEIDDNNNSKVNSNYINHQSLKLKDSEVVIDDIQFASLSDTNVINILILRG